MASVKSSTELCALTFPGHKMIVQEFIKRKMTVDIADIDGHTPLHLACLRGHQSCVVSGRVHSQMWAWSTNP